MIRSRSSFTSSINKQYKKKKKEKKEKKRRPHVKGLKPLLERVTMET